MADSHRRLQHLRPGALQLGQRAQRRLVAQLPERQHRIVLERALDLGDLDQAGQGGRDPVVAERLDDASCGSSPGPRIASRISTSRTCGLLRRQRGQRPHQRGAHELAGLLVERRQQARREPRGRVVLEVAVGDLAEAIVRRRERLFHGVHGARIAEAGEQDERLEADVAIGVLAGRIEQGRNRDRARRAPDRAAGLHPGRIVQVTQLADRGLQVRGRKRRRPALLRRHARRGRHGHGDGRDRDAARG